MSSPIHHAKDLDAALMYAPPWARDQGVAPPPERSPPLPAVEPPRIQRDNKRHREFSGDRAMLELQRQLALNPDIVPVPQLESTADLLPIALRMCAVVIAAALVAWAMVSLPGIKKSGSGAVEADSERPPLVVNRVKLVHFPSPANVLPAVADTAEAVNVSPPQPDNSPAPPQPDNSPAPPLQPSSATSVSAAPVLDDDEIAVLIKRGHDFLENGDLVSARLILQRAVEAGSADAALALGATFDPLVIRRLGVIGIEPDIARARQWYQRAAELGSTAASQQLTKLEGAR
jgi:hypothetical protein